MADEYKAIIYFSSTLTALKCLLWVALGEAESGVPGGKRRLWWWDDIEMQLMPVWIVSRRESAFKCTLTLVCSMAVHSQQDMMSCIWGRE